MSSGAKSKTSGKSPVFSHKDYLEMTNTLTQQDVINMGGKFRHSVFKTPFMGKEGLQEMEFEMSPGDVQPTKSHIPSLPLPQRRRMPLVFGADREEVLEVDGRYYPYEPSAYEADELETGIRRHRTPIVSGLDATRRPFPCRCSGMCVGSPQTVVRVWDEVERAMRDGRIRGRNAEEVGRAIEQFVRNHVRVNRDFRFELAKPVTYRCSGTGVELAHTTFICGGREEFVHMRSAVADDGVRTEFLSEIPFPPALTRNCTVVEPCRCHRVNVYVNCGAGFDCTPTGAPPRDVFVMTCDMMRRIEVFPAEGVGCSALTITNPDGSPATDTILTGGCLGFAVRGSCCGRIEWSASGTGASVTQAGVLCASSTACGSLTVTVSCPGCRTSASHSVRVANGGRWVETSRKSYGHCAIQVSCGWHMCVLVVDDICIGGSRKTLTRMCGHAFSQQWCNTPPCAQGTDCGSSSGPSCSGLQSPAYTGPGCYYIFETFVSEWRCP
ncbi:MAG: hypothetical protein DDT19_00821 [Syntrophomonadaceae bacterium]|nr:hypothetical protein [Bacillota bacterium]